MFGMSVNEVPGWLVAIAPSGIGVPVAATPGLVPQLDVLTVAALAEADELVAGVDPVPLAVLVLLLLQPAAARPRAAASRIVLRAEICLLICSPRGGEFYQFTVTTILMASGGLLIANSNASAARASGKWCENTWAMAARLAATRRIAAAKSSAVAQLEPMTSISFSGKAPDRSGTVPEDRLTTTTRPADGAISIAWASTPASPLVSMMSGGPSPPVHSRVRSASSGCDPQATTSAPRRLARSRRPGTGSTDSTRAPAWVAATRVARPIGPAPNTTTCSPARSRPRASACTATEAGSTKHALSGSRSAVPKTRPAGTSSRSARPPSRCTPTSRNLTQTLGRLLRQG